LTDPTLKLELEFLNYLINKISKFHFLLQNRKFNLGQLRSEMEFCFNNILEIVSDPYKFDAFTFDKITEIDWQDEKTKKEWLLPQTAFLEKLSYKINKDFSKLLEPKNQSFAQFFAEKYQNYAMDLLKNLVVYLPWTDKVVEAASIVEMSGIYEKLEKHVDYLNEKFGIVDESDLKEYVLPELLRLKKEWASKFIVSEKESVMTVWARIEKDHRYQHLMKIIHMIQILPVSSSNVEQLFSIAKLYRNDQRNSLSESSLEGLLLLHQEFQQSKKLVITPEVIALYKQVRSQLNERKNGKKRLNPSESKDLNEEERAKPQHISKKVKKTPKNELLSGNFSENEISISDNALQGSVDPDEETGDSEERKESVLIKISN